MTSDKATIELDGDAAEIWRLGEVRGRARWRGAAPAKPVELRVFWMTRGRGTEEIGVVGRKEFRAVDGGVEEFRFALPEEPVSFNGKLVSVAWALEVVADDEGLGLREFVHAPDGIERALGEVEKPLSKGSAMFRFG